MAGKTDTTALDFAFKKLLGKANTSNLKSDAQETIGSNIQVGATTVFGVALPNSPSQTLYTVQDSCVEYVVFDVSAVAGTTYDANDPGGGGDGAQDPGPHGYALALTGSYETNSDNSKAGSFPFTDGQVLSGSAGALQIVPGFFSTASPNPYTITLYESDGSGGIGDQIPLLDEVDWIIDTFNGILFLQDYDSTKIPAYAKGFIYTGDMMSSLTGSGGSGGGDGDSAAQYLVLSATGSLSAERVFNPSTGISVSDGGAGGNYTVSIDNSVVATLTGSQFSGNVGITGSVGIQGDLEVAQYIKHIGDDDTFIQFADDAIGITAGGEQLITISEAGQDIVKIGDGGDVDFQVRTLGDDNTLYVEGDTDRIGVGTNAPSSIIHIKETGPTLTLQRENNSNASTINFVGSEGNTANSIIHNSSTNDLVFKTFNGSAVEEIMRVGDHYGASKRQIILLSGSGMHAGAMQPKQTSDIAFFVSGSIGSKGTAIRGTSVFGGDTVISGTLVARNGISGSLTHLTDGTSYLIAGSNVTITTGSSGAITISSTGGGSSNRSKAVYTVTSSHNANSNLDITGINFSSVSYNSEKIDIFVNGQMMASGASNDYYIPGAFTGSINFTFELFDDDTITAVTY